jgi:hypothetical protein
MNLLPVGEQPARPRVELARVDGTGPWWLGENLLRNYCESVDGPPLEPVCGLC